jgi:glycosyltransferase involved in cell wall biosynthesis
MLERYSGEYSPTPTTYAIFIPAFQAEVTLARVVNRIPAPVLAGSAAVLIRDDASKDRTWEVATDLAAANAKLVVVRSPVNLGFGGTNKAAFAWMLEAGVDAFAVLHGDLQYDPESVADILEPILSGEADIVLGSRMSGHPLRGGMPWERWICNMFLTWLMNWRLGQSLTDYHTGLVGFRTMSLQTLDITSLSNGHELTAEVLIRAAQEGLRIRERSIATHYLGESRSLSRLVGVKYAWNVIKMMCTTRMSQPHAAEETTVR